jgi:hypothetical protein
MLRNDQSLAFPEGGGLLQPVGTANDDLDIIRSDGGIPAKAFVVHEHCQDFIANHGRQLFGDVGGPALHAVETADDHEIACLTAVATLIEPVFGSSRVERSAKNLAREPLRFANPSCFAHHYWFARVADCPLPPASWCANLCN